MNPASMAALDHDMTLDPRVGLPLFGIKTEKEAASTPVPMVLTPHMFDADFDMAALEAHPPAVITPMTPEGSHTPPASLALPTTKPDSPMPEADVQPRKRRRTATTTATTTTTTTISSRSCSKEDARRARCLERNRVAASKCREKKKLWVHELEATKIELEQQHANLQREYGSLLDETTRIKTTLMTHSICNDRNIDSWIEAEASRFVSRSYPKPAPSPAPQPAQDSAPSSVDDSQPPSAVSYDFLTESLFADEGLPADDVDDAAADYKTMPCLGDLGAIRS
ncbi:hypothetical protein CDD80_2899 [Ophiocordyceps camponoti-rufipedis]|uniref:BZIP domain-containing protein n=1 Tax=Ophiocordyceps camponoti-rufipedis TaxID=2004952 RepID=A0A2C5Z671_9HYPO|nr:hypothetical protein CDD80_2899 [Ophiocordyceps camponoti-rufipedis]